jgi:thiol-disulfide isomerase/thioredoxin
MFKILSIAVVATALAAATIALYDTGTQIRICDGVPDVLAAFEPAPQPVDRSAVVFSDATGTERRLADYSGHGMVINFWATWCPPCVREMPALDRLRAALAGDGIEVLALSGDRNGNSVVAPFYEKNGIGNLPVSIDKGLAAARGMGIQGLPTTVLIDDAGYEIGRLVGAAEWDAPEAIAFLQSCLEKSAVTEGN